MSKESSQGGSGGKCGGGGQSGGSKGNGGGALKGGGWPSTRPGNPSGGGRWNAPPSK